MSYSAVYTLLGVGLIPLSILAVRIAQSLSTRRCSRPAARP